MKCHKDDKIVKLERKIARQEVVIHFLESRFCHHNTFGELLYSLADLALKKVFGKKS